ncbi:MAG: hypothetical protein HY263_08150 [Chloroflexi bacterium]|nr:hypothetical protein [Chloroflexota bacterium]
MAGLILFVAVQLVAVTAIFGPGLVHRWVLGRGATDVHELASLRQTVGVCGRDYRIDERRTVRTHDEIVAWSGLEPTLVDPDPFPPCPAGVCTTASDSVPCATVVFVRVGSDAYVGYALQGGP